VQREPYSNYSLRVTIRNLCHYRVTNPELACAALLRDAVEDHAEDIAGTRKETRRPRPGIPAHPDAGSVRQRQVCRSQLGTRAIRGACAR